MSYDGHDRDIDHRDLRPIYDVEGFENVYESYTGPMDRFMQYGHIRINHSGVDMMFPPTEKQRVGLKTIFNSLSSFEVDISNKAGQKIEGFWYDRFADYDSKPIGSIVLADIDNYFSSIAIPN